jgi:hypothetical protein
MKTPEMMMAIRVGGKLDLSKQCSLSIAVRIGESGFSVGGSTLKKNPEPPSASEICGGGSSKSVRINP